jgi:DNA polymerase-3 subunit gamma/tau
LSLLDQAIAYCGGAVQEKPVGVMLGTIDRQYVNRLLQLLAADDGAGIMSAIADIDQHFPDYERLLDDVARTLQRIAVYQVIGSAEIDDDMDDSVVIELAAALAPEDVQLFYQTALIGRRDLYLAPDPRSGAEMTLLRMLAFRPDSAGTGPVRTSAKATTETPAVGARPRSQPQPASTEASKAAGNAWQEPVWADLIIRLNLDGANKLLASNCAYVGRKGNLIELALDERSKSFLTASRQQAIAEALSEYFAEKLRVDIAIGVAASETPLQEEARRSDEKLAAARNALEADPNVKALKDMFGAELNPDSVELRNL